MIEEFLRDAIKKFNERRETDEKLRKDVGDLNKKLLISLDNGKSFHFEISGGVAGELRVGAIDDADITVESDEETLKAIFNKDLKVMKALALKKIRVKASLQDMIRIRNIF